MKGKVENILFICNTYSQLITAIQIRRSLFPEAASEFMVSDHSVNADKVVLRLGKAMPTDKIVLAETKYYVYQQNVIEDFMDVWRTVFGIGKKYKKIFAEDCHYDRIFYYNHDLILYAALDMCAKGEKTPVLCQYEEGVHSYANMVMAEHERSRRLNMIARIRRLLHKKCVYGSTNDYYVFFKDFFPRTTGIVHNIPKFSRQDKELLNILNCCFGYVPEAESFNEKYIFFGSSREIDGSETQETEIVLKVAGLVGKENLLVKLHPRDGRNVYSEYGIKVSRKSDVPWDVIQMNHDFSNHVFLTMGSGSTISASALLGDQIETYFLYPLDAKGDEAYKRYCGESIKKLVARLKEVGFCQKHRIVETMDELEEILETKKAGFKGCLLSEADREVSL